MITPFRSRLGSELHLANERQRPQTINGQKQDFIPATMTPTNDQLHLNGPSFGPEMRTRVHI